MFQRQSCSPRVEDAPIDCVWGEWEPIPLANVNDEPYNAVDINGTCSTRCGTGGLQRQIKQVISDDENVDNSEVCANKIQYVACNRFDCGRSCEGSLVERNVAYETECVTDGCYGRHCFCAAPQRMKDFQISKHYKSGPLGPTNNADAQTCEERYPDKINKLIGVDSDGEEARCHCRACGTKDCRDNRY